MATATKTESEWASSIVTTGRDRPFAVLVHGEPGVGKTSLGAFADDAIFIQSRGENGLDVLISSGQVPEVAHFEQECTEWPHVKKALRSVYQSGKKYCVLDTINGLERLCHEYVCREQFGDDWSPRGYMNYGGGYTAAMPEWREMLRQLDCLREDKQMSVLALSHTRIKTFNNPEGLDYDRYEPAFESSKFWEHTKRWVDAVLFYRFYAHVADDGKKGQKGKAAGGQDRIFQTTHAAAYEAKNRYGLPEEIDCGNSGKEAWNNFTAAMDAAKNGRKNDDG